MEEGREAQELGRLVEAKHRLLRYLSCAQDSSIDPLGSRQVPEAACSRSGKVTGEDELTRVA